MMGHYRFLHTRGRSYFARVWVEASAVNGTVEVVDTLPDPVNAEVGEFNRRTAPTWVAAALDGIRQTATYARQACLLGVGCRGELTKLVGSVLDTRDDVVRCAAALAAWDGLGLPGPASEVEFDGQNWRVQFPARVPGPVEGITP